MARKVFISVLGTGFYDTCKYAKGSFVSSETRFIQQATLEYLKVKNNWTTLNAEGKVIDRIVILLTKGAKETNWEKTITSRQNRKMGVEEPYIGLEQVLNEMVLPCPVETIEIPDGKSEEEMWTIFDAVYDVLKPNDKLYFDLTHSFRYLPMLVLVLGNYAKFLKGVTVEHISYGNYEARDTDTNEAPLMDILPLTILQDWTFAAADLIQNGNIERLQELKKSSALTPLFRTKGEKNLIRRMAEEPLTNYLNALQTFLLHMKLCQAPDIIRGETTNSIITYHAKVMEVFENVIAPVPPIISKIQDSLCGFEKTGIDYPESLRNGYEAAKWCYEHQLYQQAITILEENITTHFCKCLGVDEHIYDIRKAANAYLRWGEYRECDWETDSLSGIREQVMDASTSDRVLWFIEQMRGDAIWIHTRRNIYNHASMIQDNAFTLEDVKLFGEKIRRIIRVFRA